MAWPTNYVLDGTGSPVLDGTGSPVLDTTQPEGEASGALLVTFAPVVM